MLSTVFVLRKLTILFNFVINANFSATILNLCTQFDEHFNTINYCIYQGESYKMISTFQRI